MIQIRPFKAIRPQKEFACEVAALPYDVMSSVEAKETVKGNPYSFLHVDRAEIGFDYDISPYDEAVYKKASDNLNKMIKDKILVADEQPLLYIYRLSANNRSQTGLVLCASIDDYLAGKIKKHELTREDKELDRVRHVESCNAQTGPIFLTYRRKSEISEIIHEYTKQNEPMYNFRTSDMVEHTVWVVEGSVIDELVGHFKEVPFMYIADGHHRNAAAARVALSMRDKYGSGEFDYCLSVAFPHDELEIKDYNRLIKDLNGLDKGKFLSQLERCFTVSETEGRYKPNEKHTFGLYLDGKWYKLKAKEEIINENDIIASLDVSILQENVLEAILGISDPRTDKRIDFVGGTRGLKELEKRVDTGEMAVAIAMYPTSMEELMEVADAGKIMPPKSTWFEPKLRSGIFIHTL